MWHILFSASALLACWSFVEAEWEPQMQFVINTKGTKFLDKALDAYPLDLGGESQYDDNYTLTTACHDDLVAYYGGVQDKKRWAGFMVDADGVPPSGIVDGALNWVGNYEGCLSSETEATGDEMNVSDLGVFTHDFDAKYCRATTLLGAFFPPITLGVCVPDTCTELDVEHMLTVGNDSLPVFRMYCGDDKEEYEDDAAAIAVTAVLNAPLAAPEVDVEYAMAISNSHWVILAVFAAVILSATLLDYYIEWEKERRLTANSMTGESCLNHNGSTPANGETGPTGTAPATITTTTTPTTTTATTNGLKHLAGSAELEEGEIGEKAQKANFTLATENRCPPEQETFGKLTKALLAFALRLNVNRVLSTSMPPGAYLAFNGIRFMSMTWIILGHTWQLGLYITQHDERVPLSVAENFYTQFLYQDRFIHQVINNMSLGVETFLLLSFDSSKLPAGKVALIAFNLNVSSLAVSHKPRHFLMPKLITVVLMFCSHLLYTGSCLVTISFMKQLDRQDGKPTVRQMVLYYFHRYWRLTPVYAVVIMIYTAFTYHWISGPFATETLSEVENCKSNWWANLLYIQNFYEPDAMCISWSWYLAIDFQYYCIVPLFAFVIYKYLIAGSIFLFLAYCGSLTARIVIASDDYDWWVDMYVRPWCRFGPYAIGMALGVIMYRTKCKVKLPLVAVIVGWLVAIALCLLAVFGSYNRGDCDGCSPWTHHMEVAYYSTRQHAFALGIAWLMFACSTGYGGLANTFLSWPVFVPLSKLTYIGYLLHPVLIYHNYYSQQRGLYVDALSMTTHFCFHLLMTLVIGFGFTLAFEVPMLELEKLIIPPKQKKR